MSSLRFAFRTLAKTPFITAVAILSLAFGIGANTAIFSLVEQMLLANLPVQNPQELVNLSAPGPKPGSQSCNSAGDCNAVFSYPMFRDLETAEMGLAGLAAHRLFGANLAYERKTISGQGMLVSGSYFPLLGVRPALGRLIGPQDDEAVGAHPLAVLGYRYWETELGADSSVLNQTLIINGQPMTIVGVAEQGFRGTTLGEVPDVYIPITMRSQINSGFNAFDNRRNYWVYVFGRVKEGVTLQQVSSRINTVYSGIIQEVEVPLQTGMSDQTMERFLKKELVLESGQKGQSSFQNEAGTPLRLLFAITGFVLLIACANIANLLLARGARRGPEMAIRGSLGASRTQLLVPLLTESLLLAVLGAAAGLLVAAGTLRVIMSLLPPDAGVAFSFELRPPILAFTAFLAVTTGLLFGMYPALHSTRRDLVTVLKSNAGQPSGARSAARFRNVLVTAQIALSMTLLVAAGLFVKSLVKVSRIDLGMQTENIVQLSISPGLNGYENDRSQVLIQRAEAELATIPGVRSAAAGMVPVLGGSSWGTDVSVEGFESGPDIDSNSRYNVVGPGYFSTLGIPLMAGREFTETDTAESPQIAIVNEAFTRKFNLDGPDAVGKWMSTSGSELNIQIVGVVQDAKYNDVKQEIPPLFFTPYRQNDGLRSMFFYLRTAMDPTAVTRAVPGVIARLDPNLPVDNLKSLEDQVEESLVGERLVSVLSAAFALLATLLAAIGLYGVLAYTVAQRTREFGLRIALGAAGGRIRGMVLRQVGLMTLIGGTLGIAAAIGIGRAAESLLYGMNGSDLTVLLSGAGLLILVSFGAGYVPAWRASRVDPMQALRYE